MPHPAARPDATSRLFGSAITGVKKPQPKLASRASSSKASDAPARVVKNGGKTEGTNGIRGRGTVSFSSSPKKASVPVRRQKIIRRAVHYNGEDSDAFAHLQQQLPRPDPHKEADWHHDQYTGPLPIGSSVFVRSLPKGASEVMVEALFSRIGEVVSVQMDSGPCPTATVGFVRQDTAFTAVDRFHGYWLQGEQLKVSVIETSTTHLASPEDDEFWRQELLQMPKRQPVEPLARIPSSLNDDDDEFWRRELAEMQRRKTAEPLRRDRNALDDDDRRDRSAVDDDDDFWRRELAEMKMQRRRSRSRERGGLGARQFSAPTRSASDDDDDFWKRELEQMKSRRRGRGTFRADR